MITLNNNYNHLIGSHLLSSLLSVFSFLSFFALSLWCITNRLRCNFKLFNIIIPSFLLRCVHRLLWNVLQKLRHVEHKVIVCGFRTLLWKVTGKALLENGVGNFYVNSNAMKLRLKLRNSGVCCREIDFHHQSCLRGNFLLSNLDPYTQLLFGYEKKSKLKEKSSSISSICLVSFFYLIRLVIDCFKLIAT